MKVNRMCYVTPTPRLVCVCVRGEGLSAKLSSKKYQQQLNAHPHVSSLLEQHVWVAGYE